ncbi:unnamed protein product, partial [Ectocarpus sp. 12 AP-2014]
MAHAQPSDAGGPDQLGEADGGAAAAAGLSVAAAHQVPAAVLREGPQQTSHGEGAPLGPVRGQRVLAPRGSAVSDADSVVSDIDNLSRTAAIARIRRASISDYSRPNSDQSTRSAPSLRTPGFAMGTQPA